MHTHDKYVNDIDVGDKFGEAYLWVFIQAQFLMQTLTHQFLTINRGILRVSLFILRNVYEYHR